MEQIITSSKDRTKTKSQYPWKDSDVVLEISSFDESKNILFPISIMNVVAVIHLVLENKGEKLGMVFSKNEVNQWKTDIVALSEEGFKEYFKIEKTITQKNVNKLKSMAEWIQNHINASLI